MIDAGDERRPGGVRSCCKQSPCIIAKLRYRRRRMALVRLWVQEFIVYDAMRCIVQRLWVLQHVLDLSYQRLRWVGLMKQRNDSQSTYIPENHESLQARGQRHEDRWWKVVHEPDKDYRVLSQRDSRREGVDSSDNVSLKIRR